MARLEVLTWPDPRLLRISTPVAVVDEATRRLVADLMETLRAQRGAGLAAPQVGVTQRVIIIDRSRGDEQAEGTPIALINPRLQSATGEVLWREGCLSVPGVTAEVERFAEVTVSYLDADGQAQRMEAAGLTAVCLQHEIDHLDGRLYLHRLGPLERRAVERDYEAARAAEVEPR